MGTERKIKLNLHEHSLLLPATTAASSSCSLLLRSAADSDFVLCDVRRELPVLELGVRAELLEDLFVFL